MDAGEFGDAIAEEAKALVDKPERKRRPRVPKSAPAAEAALSLELTRELLEIVGDRFYRLTATGTPAEIRRAFKSVGQVVSLLPQDGPGESEAL